MFSCQMKFETWREHRHRDTLLSDDVFVISKKDDIIFQEGKKNKQNKNMFLVVRWRGNARSITRLSFGDGGSLVKGYRSWVQAPTAPSHHCLAPLTRTDCQNDAYRKCLHTRSDAGIQQCWGIPTVNSYATSVCSRKEEIQRPDTHHHGENEMKAEVHLKEDWLWGKKPQKTIPTVCEC